MMGFDPFHEWYKRGYDEWLSCYLIRLPFAAIFVLLSYILIFIIVSCWEITRFASYLKIKLFRWFK